MPTPDTTPPAAAGDDASVLLRRAADRAGLGDLALARIARYEAMIGRGEREAAIEGLAQLNAELDAATRKVAVAPGENLRAFAGRPDIYGNAALWPLIWRANLDQLPEPWAVQRDQLLAVPSHPPLADIAAAIRYAESHPQDVVRPATR